MITTEEIETIIYNMYLENVYSPEEFFKIIDEINKRIYYMNINQ